MSEADIDAKRVSLLDLIQGQSDRRDTVTRVTVVASVADVLTQHSASRLAGEGTDRCMLTAWSWCVTRVNAALRGAPCSVHKQPPLTCRGLSADHCRCQRRPAVDVRAAHWLPAHVPHLLGHAAGGQARGDQRMFGDSPGLAAQLGRAACPSDFNHRRHSAPCAWQLGRCVWGRGGAQAGGSCRRCGCRLDSKRHQFEVHQLRPTAPVRCSFVYIRSSGV